MVSAWWDEAYHVARLSSSLVRLAVKLAREHSAEVVQGIIAFYLPAGVERAVVAHELTEAELKELPGAFAAEDRIFLNDHMISASDLARAIGGVLGSKPPAAPRVDDLEARGLFIVPDGYLLLREPQEEDLAAVLLIAEARDC